jgi:hypothetical protein
MQTEEASKYQTHLKRMVGELGSVESVRRGRRPVSSAKNWVCAADELPGVMKDDMS